MPGTFATGRQVAAPGAADATDEANSTTHTAPAIRPLAIEAA